MDIKKGIRLRHHKGGIYEVLMVLRDADSLEEMVVYQQVHTKQTWVRALARFFDTVTRPNGEKVKRFEPIEGPIPSTPDSFMEY
jgi:hypothetical protein